MFWLFCFKLLFNWKNFAQNVGGWFDHMPLNKFISFLACFIFLLKLEDYISFWRDKMMGGMRLIR